MARRASVAKAGYYPLPLDLVGALAACVRVQGEASTLVLETPREKWTVATARSAMRTVSFVARMSGAENGPEVCGGWSKREISLRNWAHNPRA